ncbi:MAG: hypothetical protein JSR60_07405 [Proteobacteria bacterium]|nr:hypothetical protein [Pseudomonadota bacterium]
MIGGALMTIGVLIFVPSGLCSAFLGLGALVTLVAAPSNLIQMVQENWLFFLSIVAVAAGGCGLYFLGLRIGSRDR